MKTPYTDIGLRQYDHLDPMDALIKAWTDAGVNPQWHRRAQEQVRSAMPVLARALDRMANVDQESEPSL